MGYDDIQSNLVALFSKLSSYSIQFSTQFTSSDKLVSEPTLALVQHVGTSAEGKLSSFTESGLTITDIQLASKLGVDGFDMLKTAAIDNQTHHVSVDTAISVSGKVNENIKARVIYESFATAKMVGETLSLIHI